MIPTWGWAGGGVTSLVSLLAPSTHSAPLGPPGRAVLALKLQQLPLSKAAVPW